MFDEQFETVVADTESSKTIHYNLRYQIYCLERRFENPVAFPDKRETDLFDKNSVHFIVRHRNSGEWIGAMRLVLAVPTKLPLARVGAINQDSIGSLKDAMVSEVSRLCVLPSRQWGTTERLDIVHPSFVTLALIRAAREYNLTHNIQFSYFLTPAELARIWERVGIQMKPVGPIVHYHGVRRPYLHDWKNGYKAMRDKLPLLYKKFLVSPAYKYHSNTSLRRLHQPGIQLFR